MKVSIKAAASALGYLFILPDTPRVVTDTFRRWCKEHTQPSLDRDQRATTSLTWISRRQVALEGIVAEDAESAFLAFLESPARSREPNAGSRRGRCPCWTGAAFAKPGAGWSILFLIEG
jgi:hypothetical protein